MKTPKTFVRKKDLKKRLSKPKSSSEELADKRKKLLEAVINREPGWEQIVKPKLSAEEESLIEKYKEGVKVYIFKYTGVMDSYLQLEIDNFDEHWCDTNGIAYEVFRVSDKHFSDVRNSVILEDEYGENLIIGIHEVRDYMLLLNKPSYQKYNIIPKIKRRLSG